MAACQRRAAGTILRGRDHTRPIPLFLNGGPGIPDYFLAQNAELEQLFTVCCWDYRGTGLSYSSEIRPEGCTTEQSVQDALAVTDALRAVQTGPDLSDGPFLRDLHRPALRAGRAGKYHAYIAMGQSADQPRSELTALHAMEQAAQRQGDRRTAERLTQYDTEPADTAWLRRWFSEPERDRAMHALGGGTTAQMRPVISGIFFPTLRCTDYTQTERINIWRGKALLQNAPTVYDRMEFSAADTVPSLELPVYFFAGENDLTCCYAVQRDYFDRLSASEKGFYTFAGCAHSPLFESPAQALRILREDVLTGRFTLADGAEPEGAGA